MRSIRLLLAAGILVVAAGVACAQGKFPLKAEDVTDKTRVVAEQMMRGVDSVEAPAADKLPAALKEGGTFFKLSLGGKDVLFGETAGKSPSVWVDTNGDGSLADEKPLPRLGEAKDDSPVAHFGPATVSVPGAPKAVLDIMTMNFGGGGAMMISPAAVLAGTARIGDKDYRVVIGDRDFDGKCAAFGAGNANEGGYSMLAIDLNGNGTFTDETDADEVMPMPRMIGIGGAWWSLRVVDGGAALEVAKVEPKFGTIDVGTSGAEIGVLSDAGAQRLKGQGGKSQVPEGLYALSSITYHRADKDGRDCTLSAFPGEAMMKPFAIAANQTTSLKMGLPAVAKAEINVENGQALISLSFAGQGGEAIYPIVNRGDKAPAEPPKFKLVNELGKELASGQFAFG